MYNLRVLVLTAIIAALAHCSVAEETAGIKCYVCEEALNKDCGAGFKPPKEDDDSGNSTSVVEPGAIAIQEDCKFCVVNRITTNDVSVITRGCSSADVNLGCVSALVITTCTTSCNTKSLQCWRWCSVSPFRPHHNHLHPASISVSKDVTDTVCLNVQIKITFYLYESTILIFNILFVIQLFYRHRFKITQIIHLHTDYTVLYECKIVLWALLLIWYRRTKYFTDYIDIQ